MKTRLLAVATAVNLTLISGASAQSVSNAESKEEIIVQGHRAYLSDFESLETPQSASTLDAELLSDAGVLNLNQALDLSASVARQNNFGGLWNSFSVRGFAGDINLPSGFLVNGFNAGRGFGGPRDIVGIESVEVMRGPRSALFGRGEPGGTINLTTKRPQFEEAGEIQATIGSWNQARVTGDWQTTMGDDDNVGLRLVGFYEDAESFRETVESQKVGFYPSLKWQMSDDTSFSYELEYTKQEIPFDRGVAFTEEFGFTPRRTFVGEPGDGPIDTEVVGHQFEIQHDISDKWSLLTGFGYRETSLIGNASETNFAGRQTLFLDGSTLSRFFRFRDFDSEYTVLRAELAGEFNTGALRHRVLLGADYDRFENRLFILRARPGFFSADTDIATLDPSAYRFLDVFNPVYGQSPIPVPGPNTDREEVLTGAGIYFQDQIDISDQFQIRIGGRFDDFEQDLSNLRASPVTTTTTSDTRFSPQVGAVYLLSEGLSLYASYGEGFRQQTGSDFLGNQFEPNITESTEMGVKADLDALGSDISGTISLAAFQVNQSNILVNDDRPEAVAAGFFSTSAGEAQSRGVEVDVNLEFSNDMRLWLSYAYTDAEFTTSNPDADFGALIEAGDPLINSPKNQLNIQVSKGFDIADMNAQVGAGVLYTDERLGWTGFDFSLPSYTTVRLFGELKPSERLSVRLDIDNLFDETFYTNSFADVWVEPGAPRSFRLTASYKF
jgi:iron complex outermembrane receptor protein